MMLAEKLKRNPALLHKAAAEVSEALCKKPMRPHPALMRTEVTRILSGALARVEGIYVSDPLPPELNSRYFGEGRLQAQHERHIQEGNALIKRLRQVVCRPDLVAILTKKAHLSPKTANEIIDEFIFAD